MFDLTVNFDGGCSPCNPGGTASWGIAAKNCLGEVFLTARGVVGSGMGMSNNVGEHEGLFQALTLVEDVAHSGWRVLVCGDSMLAVYQLTGAYRATKFNTKTGKLNMYWPYYLKSADKLRVCRAMGIVVSLRWVPREENMDADEQTELAVIERGIRPFTRR